MLEQVVTSPLVPQVAKLIESRLKRPLEPFDVWYSGFRPGSQYTEAQLDEMVAKKYPTAQAYQQDIPNLLMKLGFSSERAQYVAHNIVVDPARGSGHAMGAEMRAEKAHLRTRVEKERHELQGLQHRRSRNGTQRRADFLAERRRLTRLLKGVPNTAFTEALAFVFQGHDLELLGLPRSPTPRAKAEKDAE